MSNISLFNNLTMTSKEIAELVEKRHDNVKRTIETLADQGVISHPQIEGGIKAANGVVEQLYVFDHEHKRDTFIVVAQLSPQFTARLVDRWQELEAQLVQPTAPQLFGAEQRAAELAPSFVAAAKAFGFEGNQATLSADKAIKALTGVGLLALMGHTHLVAEVQAPLLTVTDLGKRLGLSPNETNMVLVRCKLQTDHRDLKQRLYYELTPEGRAFGVYLDTGKTHSNGTPIRQIKWHSTVVERIHSIVAEAMTY
ncbi:Rha family transcriptional regulator [Chromatium okenii]|jgi:phage regulator Rha-like protein|uniref:Rha family transcriptional regulator n=1 Tax=Chromatium okenii TaxID=61644 RepID=UPI0026EB3CF2|nr:Rha family transcriptional regulator [Chromatium okenii]MBV5310892.1 Rha family transcriptional regulator [Chromatium okenii]